MSLVSKFVKQYLGFLLGLVFGSIVSTLVTYAFFVTYYGEIPNIGNEEIQQFQECLVE